jgi:hypothetical protein
LIRSAGGELRCCDSWISAAMGLLGLVSAEGRFHGTHGTMAKSATVVLVH